jgi:hypothetical protein
MNVENGGALSLAARWGFTEADQRLVELHEQVVSALIAGVPTQPLWQRYREISDLVIEQLPDGPERIKARAAREIVQGLIWIKGGAVPQGMSHLLLAEATARNSAWLADEKILSDEIATFGTEAEYFLAEGYFFEAAGDTEAAGDRFEAALAIYYEAEDDDTITVAHRGLVNLRTAEGYLGLIRVGKGNRGSLEEQIVAHLESAADYLRGTPAFAHAQSLLNELAATDWWDAAIERQHA